jgi:hypothetical protein
VYLDIAVQGRFDVRHKGHVAHGKRGHDLLHGSDKILSNSCWKEQKRRTVIPWHWHWQMRCLVLSCLVLSCLVLSCLVLSCLVLSCLVLSCLDTARRNYSPKRPRSLSLSRRSSALSSERNDRIQQSTQSQRPFHHAIDTHAFFRSLQAEFGGAAKPIILKPSVVVGLSQLFESSPHTAKVWHFQPNFHLLNRVINLSDTFDEQYISLAVGRH